MVPRTFRFWIDASDDRIKRRVLRAVRDLGWEPIRDPGRSAGTVVFGDEGLRVFEGDSVIVLATRPLRASAFRGLVEGRAIAVRLDLLDADYIERGCSIEGGFRARGDLRTVLMASPLLAAIPKRLIGAFVDNPGRCRSLKDAARELGKSTAVTREVVHQAGFRRTVHLWTTVRAEAWRWFVRTGVPAHCFQTHLGITDPSTFRRSCRRAAYPSAQLRP